MKKRKSAYRVSHAGSDRPDEASPQPPEDVKKFEWNPVDYAIKRGAQPINYPPAVPTRVRQGSESSQKAPPLEHLARRDSRKESETRERKDSITRGKDADADYYRGMPGRSAPVYQEAPMYSRPTARPEVYQQAPPPRSRKNSDAEPRAYYAAADWRMEDNTPGPQLYVTSTAAIAGQRNYPQLPQREESQESFGTPRPRKSSVESANEFRQQRKTSADATAPGGYARNGQGYGREGQPRKTSIEGVYQPPRDWQAKSSTDLGYGREGQPRKASIEGGYVPPRKPSAGPPIATRQQSLSAQGQAPRRKSPKPFIRYDGKEEEYERKDRKASVESEKRKGSADHKGIELLESVLNDCENYMAEQSP
jgi:hypothetical protein